MTDESKQINRSIIPMPSYAIAKTSDKGSLARRGLLALEGLNCKPLTNITPEVKHSTATITRTTTIICDNEQSMEVIFIPRTNRRDAKKAMKLQAAEMNKDGFCIKQISHDEYICLLDCPEVGYYEEIRLSLPCNTKLAKVKAKQLDAKKSG